MTLSRDAGGPEIENVQQRESLHRPRRQTVDRFAPALLPSLFLPKSLLKADRSLLFSLCIPLFRSRSGGLILSIFLGSSFEGGRVEQVRISSTFVFDPWFFHFRFAIDGFLSQRLRLARPAHNRRDREERKKEGRRLNRKRSSQFELAFFPSSLQRPSSSRASLLVSTLLTDTRSPPPPS